MNSQGILLTFDSKWRILLPKRSLQVFFNLDTHRSVAMTTPCGMNLCPVTPNLPFFFQFQSPSPVRGLSVLDLLEVQPCKAKCINVALPVVAAFLSSRKCSKCFYSGVHLRVYRRTACFRIPNIPVSLPYVCSNTDFPPRDKLRTYKHMCLSAAWYPGADAFWAALRCFVSLL